MPYNIPNRYFTLSISLYWIRFYKITFLKNLDYTRNKFWGIRKVFSFDRYLLTVPEKSFAWIEVTHFFQICHMGTFNNYLDKKKGGRGKGGAQWYFAPYCAPLESPCQLVATFWTPYIQLVKSFNFQYSQTTIICINEMLMIHTSNRSNQIYIIKALM